MEPVRVLVYTLLLWSLVTTSQSSTTEYYTDSGERRCVYCDDSLTACQSATEEEICNSGSICQTEVSDYGGGVWGVVMGCQDKQSCEDTAQGGVESYGCTAGEKPQADAFCTFCCDSDLCNSEHIEWGFGTESPDNSTFVDWTEYGENTTDVFTEEAFTDIVEGLSTVLVDDLSTAGPDVTTIVEEVIGTTEDQRATTIIVDQGEPTTERVYEPVETTVLEETTVLPDIEPSTEDIRVTPGEEIASTAIVDVETDAPVETSTLLQTAAPETDEPVTNPPETVVPITDGVETAAPVTDGVETAAPVTDEVGTAAPATEEAETDQPATEEPDTEPPIVDKLTTVEANPSTPAIDTEAPETEAPDTEAPETEAPETEAPATEAPPTEAPETEAPPTEAPETEAPPTEAPETEAPPTGAPETEAPPTEAPETPAPETDAPVVDTTVASTSSKPLSSTTTAPLPTTEEAPTTEAHVTNATEKQDTDAPVIETTIASSSKPLSSTTSAFLPTTADLPHISTTGAAPPTRNYTLHCYLCNEESAESVAFCNATASEMECDSVEEVCFWSVENIDGDLFAHKGCLPRQNCSREYANNDEWCSIGSVTGNCTFCCEDADLCNYDRFPYSPTTPAPVTTYSPQPECNVTGAWDCLQLYQEAIDETIVDPTLYFSEFCRNIPTIFMCLTEALKDCCDSEASILNSTFIGILGDMKDRCPGECSVQGGYNCTYDYYERICTAIVEGDNCVEIDSITVEQKRCRDIQVGSCEQDDRVSIVTTYTIIEREITTYCEADPITLPPPSTDNPSCFEYYAKECITKLGKRIIKFLLEGGDPAYICDLVEGARECVKENTLFCPEYVIFSLDRAMEFTVGLLGDTCEALTLPVCDMPEARECVVELWRLVYEVEDFATACQLIDIVRWCVGNNTKDCTDREKESINDMLDTVLDTIGNRCEQIIQLPAERNLTISECGQSAEIVYTITQDPSILCGKEEPCDVFIDFHLEAGNTKCRGRKGYTIPQAVFGADDVDNACSRPITSENVNTPITVPIHAKIDFKIDRTQIRQLTMFLRKEKNGEVFERRSLANFTLTIEDCETQAKCKSINDPHMTTFDNYYYNNFLEGHFTLYKHKTMPYEVQMIAQSCNYHATCNCGVGIRAGDTVFYVDKCRRKNQDWCTGVPKYQCRNMMKVAWTIWPPQGVTPGLHVYKKNYGRVFEIVMPHGVMVKITVQGEYLNAWVTPSPMDKGQVEGLCGNFNGNNTDDLQLRNGTLYQGEDYDVRGGQPVGFSKDWRLGTTEQIYYGVPLNQYTPPRYCTCTVENNVVKSSCGYEELLDLCDFDSTKDITGVIAKGPSKPVTGCKGKSKHCKSSKSSKAKSKAVRGEAQDDMDFGREVLSRVRRQEEEVPEDDEFDLDEDFEGGASEDSPWNRTTARTTCEEFFNQKAVFTQCQQGLPEESFDIANDLDGCVDDLVITGNDTWMRATLEAIKQTCEDVLNKDPAYAEEDANGALADAIAAINCPQECNDQGTCDNGTCNCDTGFSGDDCSFDLNEQITSLKIANEGLCDTSDFGADQCSSVEMTGFGFIPDNVECLFQPITVTEDGISNVPGEEEVTGNATLLSPSQVTCDPPSPTSYNVRVRNIGAENASAASAFVVFNSICYQCTAGLGALCTRTSTSCIIQGDCVAQGSSAAGDACQICDPDVSDSEWVTIDNVNCRGWKAGHIAAVSVSAVVVVAFLATVGLVLYKKGQRKSAYLTDDKASTKSASSVHRSNSSESYGSPNYAYSMEDVMEVYRPRIDPGNARNSDFTNL